MEVTLQGGEETPGTPFREEPFHGGLEVEVQVTVEMVEMEEMEETVMEVMGQVVEVLVAEMEMVVMGRVVEVLVAETELVAVAVGMVMQGEADQMIES